MKSVTLAIGALTFGLSASAQCGTSSQASNGQHWTTHHEATISLVSDAPHHGRDIVDTARAAGQFGTLLAAAEAAGLVGALQGDGPITVFAPTDDAFGKLPGGTVESLLKPENRGLLRAILTYHVVPGRVLAKDVVNLSTARTLEGQRIDVSIDDGSVFIDESKVIATDVTASNGVIHVIDTVLMPSTDDIIATAGAAGSFSTLATAIKAAGLVEALQGDGPFTVFAPTDEAFAALPRGTVESLLRPENRHQLTDILTYHVVSGRVYSDAALSAQTAETLQGDSLRISLRDGALSVNNARVISSDIDTSNGVIHVIDGVLLPQ